MSARVVRTARHDRARGGTAVGTHWAQRALRAGQAPVPGIRFFLAMPFGPSEALLVACSYPPGPCSSLVLAGRRGLNTVIIRGA